VLQPGDPIACRSILFRRGVLIRMNRTIRINGPVVRIDRSAVRIFRGLGNPQLAIWTPIQRDDLFDEGLERNQVCFELWVDLELFNGLLRCGWSARRVSERGEFIGFAELINIGTFASPGDAAQENGPIMRRLEGGVLMPGNTDKRAVGSFPALPGLFIGPD